MIVFDAVVVTAMADEATPFLDRADHVGPTAVVGRALHRVVAYAETSVLLVQSGIGLVNATAAASVALTTVRARALVSAGSAGGIGTGVRVGDVVVGSRFLHAGADARAFGYLLGQVPGMPPHYEADADLHAAAIAVDADGLRLQAGTMISGDTFVDATTVEAVRAAFPDALSTDMESTALAQTAALYDVPFLAVRGISDLCGPAAEGDFRTHVDDAADRSAVVVIESLLSRQPR